MPSSSSSSPDNDERNMETERSSVTNAGGTGLDTIIQSLNKRYEMYQKRRAIVTPFDSPEDAALAAAPPRSILEDSNAAAAATATSKVLSANGSAGQSMCDPLGESIRVVHTHPAPYWEERELYIVAESLCCYLNGGVNYRLVCEQYQRALELVLTLVREDVQLCASGEVEVVAGGTTHVLAKLQQLLKESRAMLAEAGVDVPPTLSSLLDQLPAPETIIIAAERPFAHTPTAHRTRSAQARPPSALLSSRRPVSATAPHAGVHDTADGNGSSGGAANGSAAVAAADVVDGNRRPVSSQKRRRTSISTPDSFTHPAAAPTATAAPAAIVLDSFGGQREHHGGILRPSTVGSTSVRSSAAPSPLANASTASTRAKQATPPHAAHPPQNGESPGPAPPGRYIRGGAAGEHADDAAEAISPIPSSPPPPLFADLVAGVNAITTATSRATSAAAAVAVAAGDDDAEGEESEKTTANGRSRLRALQEVYGEHYRLDGMAMLTDALGVVFTREYDQGAAAQYQNGFPQFQRDVNAKVVPALKTYEALQLRITELTPLRSAYLASCLARRVAPHDTVLEQLKRIDQDRTAETLLLGGLHLGDQGTAAVVESVVPRLYRLRTLNLCDNNIHDSTVEHLLRALRYHPALETLDLSRNPITDTAVPYLLRVVQTVPKLRQLLLQSTGMSPEAKQAVETEMTQPGTYVLPTPSARRPRSSLPGAPGRAPAVLAAVLPVGSAASLPPGAPHPPTAHRPPTALDGRHRWSPKATAAGAARAESMPTRVTSAARHSLTSASGPVAANGGVKLPPLPRTTPGH